MTLQHSQACNSRQVQIQDNEIQFEVSVSQHLERLLAIPCNVKFESHRAGCQHLLDEKSIANIIFDEKDVRGFHHFFGWTAGDAALFQVPPVPNGYNAKESVATCASYWPPSPLPSKISFPFK